MTAIIVKAFSITLSTVKYSFSCKMFVFDSFIYLSFVRMKLETITSEDNPDEVDPSYIPLLTFTKNRLIEFSPLF